MTASTTTTYVRYLFPGVFFPEENARPVASRDTERAAATAPEGAFAFTFFDRVTTTVETGSGNADLSGDLGESARYYIGGQVFDAAGVEALPGDHKILLDNMRCNGWEQVIRCRPGNWQPLEPGDVVISGGRES